MLFEILFQLSQLTMSGSLQCISVLGYAGVDLSSSFGPVLR